jgi:hypothetical protein
MDYDRLREDMISRAQEPIAHSPAPPITRDIALYHKPAALRLMFEAFNAANRADFNSVTTAQYNFNVPATNLRPPILQLTPGAAVE